MNRESRETVFRRGAVEGAVLTYKAPCSDVWTTMVFVFSDDGNPGITNETHTRKFADRQHDEAVHMLELMGFSTGERAWNTSMDADGITA